LPSQAYVGVSQGDTDEGRRRSVVKHKTAEYLVYAEKLHHRYLDSSGTDGSRWRQLQVPWPATRLQTGLYVRCYQNKTLYSRPVCNVKKFAVGMAGFSVSMRLF